MEYDYGYVYSVLLGSQHLYRLKFWKYYIVNDGVQLNDTRSWYIQMNIMFTVKKYSVFFSVMRLNISNLSRKFEETDH